MLTGEVAYRKKELFSRLGSVQKEIVACDRNVKLLVAVKYATLFDIEILADYPGIILGENYVQSLMEHRQYLDAMKKHVQWHFMGVLQKNKVRKAVQFSDCIQSATSLALLKRIDMIAGQENKRIAVFLQFNIGKDPAKSGFVKESVYDLSWVSTIRSFQNIIIKGIMIVTPKWSVGTHLHALFQDANNIFNYLRKIFNDLTTLSMGMSEDYHIALDFGSTMLRLGSVILKGRDI